MRFHVALPVLLLLLATPARPAPMPFLDDADASAGGAASQDALYEEGTAALDAKKWDKALQAFDAATRLPGERTDGAIYWKAYAESRLGRRSEAAATLGELKKRFPKSRWMKDAAALELEIRHGANADEAVSSADDELKLMAINSLMNTDPERAIPLLEKVLHGRGSRELKERAVFVLTQNRSPRALAIVAEIARGKRDPELQEEAIQYLGTIGGRESREILSELYASGNAQAKEHVLHAWMASGERDRILSVARTEKSAELRETAIQLLGAMGARAELWQMYGAETQADLKEAIIDALAVGGDVEHLTEIARTEKSRELRVEAIQRLGITGKKSEAILVSIYKAESDAEVKEAALNGLFVSGNAHALVELARGEKDRKWKAAIVEKLSVMGSKEANDYMLEILER